MFRSRITQGIAGAALSVLGLGGLAALSSPPAVAQVESAPADTDVIQQQMDDMIAQCTQMMGMMSNMMGGGMSNTMGSGMSNTMGGNR